ncbi:exodeoxyribonuclease V subunit alpha [Georgenia thermotolerans]|uniref:RecBCD enzyme subunit RecD n=1 Tax=Georgenia thermotolerans TaxID=527326 RepID=A0A7J5USC3_9MICO|nr:exodeoxyribonuclease V subunit alpha [Georgenia thermotolerans]KAE8765306.1 exodeoxyribonuclease V subunit alpha [Georgenia thermotolerans]
MSAHLGIGVSAETRGRGVSAETRGRDVPAETADVAADPRIALHAGPLLAQFNAAGILAAADVHVARRLGRLAREADERVLLAGALAVRAVRSGSVCVFLDDLAALAVPEGEDVVEVGELPWPEPGEWRAAIEASPLVAVGVHGPADRPVRWLDGRLYLDRYWRHEMVVRRAVDARLGALAPAPAPAEAVAAAAQRLFPSPQDDRQRLAAATAVRSRLTVLTGGPGTGKTTTVARVLAVLQEVAGPGLRVALAAPTGKAAARLQEAVRAEVARLAEPDRAAVGEPEATTVHRLLGWRPGSSTRFRHDADHHLPHDVVVVDETSMVSLPLMARLLEALRPEARLLLVGDPDQLASVEAGAVLGDLVARPPVADALPAALAAIVPDDVPTDAAALAALRNGVVRLERVHRFSGAIAELASAIRAGDADRVLAVLRSDAREVEFVEAAGERLTDAEVAGVRHDATAAGAALVAAARAGDAAEALNALESHRLLLAHRRGPAGVAHWAGLVEGWVREAAGPDATQSPWYPGRPLLVTSNDRDTGLYNGDTGVVVGDGAEGVVAVFGDPDQPLRVRPHRLPPVETVHAMTVHRGQGSQFAHVSLVLPPATSPLLTRELLYTAVTRAQELVRIVGAADAVRAAVERPVRRASGLREPL